MQFKAKLAQSTLGRCIAVFSKADRLKIGVVTAIQVFLGALDLLGVAIIGVIGALAVSGIQSGQPGNRVSAVLKLLRLENYTFQTQTAILALAATLLLVGRTILSILFIRKTLFFIARRSAVISADLIQRLLNQNMLFINVRTVQESIYSLTSGVTAVTLGVVGTAVAMISDTTLLLVMIVGLVVVDPLIALSTLIMFAGVGLALYKLMHIRARKLGEESAKFEISSNEMIHEVLTSYREATARNRRGYYSQQIGNARFGLSHVQAEQQFMPNVSKYVIEITMVLGAVLISAVQFLFQDSKHAIATLAVFLAAGTRIAPAVLRVQQGAINIRGAFGSALPTLDLIATLPRGEKSEETEKLDTKHEGFNNVISVKNVSFSYPAASKKALSDVSIQIPSGGTCAIVGSSGSGKTTLVDLILGMFSPDSGEILVSGLSPMESIKKFPGAIGYVPQDVAVYQGTIRENIALGFPASDATDERINDALKIAQLKDFVDSLPQGIDTQVGPRGSKLSGGQRQRLGIARAMFTRPKLLILDESTSALDAQTEVMVTESLQEIPYDITTIIIAHRLSTVRDADQVIYLEEGKLIARGTFEEVRAQVPDFDTQARLMGL